jgi:hypothetical protein
MLLSFCPSTSSHRLSKNTFAMRLPDLRVLNGKRECMPRACHFFSRRACRRSWASSNFVSYASSSSFVEDRHILGALLQ